MNASSSMNPASPVSTSSNGGEPQVEVNEFVINRPLGQDSIVYQEGDEHFDRGGAHDEGALLIRLGIDGLWTIVNVDRGHTSQLTLLEHGIAALTEIRDQIERMTPTHGRSGHCLAQGDWGRCHDREGHEGAHAFPSERDWKSLRSVGRLDAEGAA